MESRTVSSRSRWAAVALASLFFLCAIRSAQAQSYTWIGPVGLPPGNDGSWQDPTQWSPIGVPGAADSATLSTGTNAVLNADVTIKTFTLVNGNVTGGFKLKFPVGSTFAISCGDTFPQLSVATVQVDGTMTYNTHNGFCTVGANVVINISAGAILDIQSASTNGGADLTWGAQPFATLNNAGTLQCSAATVARLGINVVNTGLINITGGNKLYCSVGHNAGNPTTILNNGTVIKGSGLTVDQGFLQMNGTTTINSPDTFELTAFGAMNGSGNAVLGGTGTFNWSGGTISSTGKLSISPGFTLSINCNGSVSTTNTLDTGTLEIGGTATYNAINGGLMSCSNGAPFNILPGGLLDIQSVANSPAIDRGGSTVATLTNAGTVRVSNGTNGTIGVNFANTGTINLKNGKLFCSQGHNGFSPTTFLNNGTLITGTGLTFNDGFLEINGTTTINFPDSFEVTGNGNMDGTGIGIIAGTGTLKWDGGTISGTGKTTIAAGATLAINCNGSISPANTLDTRTLEIAGTATYNASNGGLMTCSNGAPFNILAGGLLDIQSVANFPAIDRGGASVATLTNAGTVQVSNGTVGTIGIHFANSGTINLKSGKLYCSQGHNGFSPTSYLNNGTRIKGTGLTFNDGFLEMNGTTTINSPDSFELTTGGTMDGNGTGLIIGTGTMNWTGGTISGTGKTTVSAGATLAINCKTSGALVLDTRTLEIAGTATYNASNGGLLSVRGGALFNILASGLLDFQSVANTAINLGDASVPTLTNAGTIQASGTTPGIAINFVNSGTISLNNGGLFFNQTGKSTLLNDGTLIKGTGLTFNAGTLQMSGTTTINAPDSFSVIAGSTLSGTAASTIAGTGTIQWSGGTWSGTGKTSIAAGATLALDCTTAVLTLDTRTLEISGTATYNAGPSGYFQALNGAPINILSGGLLDIQTPSSGGSRDFAVGSGTAPSINNAGTLRKSASTAAATINIVTSSAGSIEALAGTLIFNSPVTQTAGRTLLNGGSLNIPTETVLAGTFGGVGTFTGNLISSGTVTPGISGTGLLSIAGSYTQNSGGTLAIELNGLTAGSQYDQLAVSGTASLAGTLTATYLNGYTPPAGSTFDVLTYASKSGAFTTVPSNVNPPLTTAQNAAQVRLTSLALILPSFSNAPSIAPNPALINQSISFNTAATISNNAPLFYVWSFGDGSATMSGSSVAHAFSSSGTFSGTVSVSDGTHIAVSQSIRVTVNKSTAFSAAPTASPNPALVNAPVTFTASATTGTSGALVYTWNFGDGSPAGSGASVMHKYAATGTYSANVTVSDGISPPVSASVTVMVVSTLPAIISFTSGQNPSLLTETVPFTFLVNYSDAATLPYSLDFGDNSPVASGTLTPGTPVTVTHNYSAFSDAGVTAKLTISGGASPVTQTLLQTIPAPASGAINVPNIAQDAAAIMSPLATPLGGMSMQVTSSNGGVIELAINVDALTRNTYSVSTTFGQAAAQSSTVSGLRPVHQFTHHGIFIAKSTATNVDTQKVTGAARLTLAISSAETGEATSSSANPAAADTSRAAKPNITKSALKGKFAFAGTSLDTVSYTGTIALAPGFDTTKSHEVFLSIGNIVAQTTINTKGTGTVPGTPAVLKSVKFSTKVKKGGVSKGGELATITTSYSVAGMVANGFDTEGISNQSTDIGGKNKSAMRMIQVALLVDGVPYRTLVPVQFSLSGGSTFGNITGRSSGP